MATYKVLQDIEAEDKLLGPLSLRQFIYAIIAIVCLFLGWQLSRVQFIVGLPMIIPAAFFGLLAAPLGAYQSSEIWLLAKIRFFLKPQHRIWDQTGLKELVTITAPKQIEHQFTNNLSQTEVRSRLQALANTIDSRGWAIKNVSVNLSAQPGYLTGQASDRLIDVATLPQEVTTTDITANDDILDAQNNPTAQHLDAMITASSQAHRQEVLDQMQQSTSAVSSVSGSTSDDPPADYWFMNQNQGHQGPLVAPGGTSPTTAAAKAPTTAEEKALLENIHDQKSKHKGNPYGHMRTLKPIGERKAGSRAGSQTTDADIINLANNDDLDVATIARQAHKKPDQGSDEVVISLR